MNRFKRVGLALATAGLLVCSVAQAQPTYTITDLGSINAVAINARGQVAGYAGGSAVIWESGNIQEIPGLSSLGRTIAADINDSGQVVGSSLVNYELGRPVFHAFLYDNGSVIDLGGGSATGINNYGTVVFLTGRNSLAINDKNQIAGSFNPVPGHPEITHAFRSDDSGTIDLGSPSGILGISFATNINNAGTVVGYVGNYPSGAFYYDDESGMHVFTSPSTPGAQANAINDLGQIVGTRIIVTNSTGIAGAFFYYPGSPPIDLNDTLANGSGWHLLEATDINNLGQIVGNGMLNGQRTSFLLTPIPEPETYAMLLAGLGLLVFVARRKHQESA